MCAAEFSGRGGRAANALAARTRWRVARGNAPVWSPDGGRLAFVREGELFVSDADGRRVRRVEGLPHELVRAVYETPQGAVYIGTSRGLAVLRADEPSVTLGVVAAVAGLLYVGLIKAPSLSLALPLLLPSVAAARLALGLDRHDRRRHVARAFGPWSCAPTRAPTITVRPWRSPTNGNGSWA